MLNLKKTAPQYICVLIYTSGQQITLSKTIFCVLPAEWGTTADFAVKPLSSN